MAQSPTRQFISRLKKAEDRLTTLRRGFQSTGGANPPVINVERYRSGSNNDEDSILLALEDAATDIGAADAQAGNGRAVLLPHTQYEIAGRIQPDRLVDIRGAGKRGTRIICTDPGAGIDFGQRLGDHDVGGSGSTLGYRGGNSGGFVVDGGGIATDPLVVGRSFDRQFIDMKVMKSAGNGALITGAQNCGFFGFDVDDCVGSTLVFDGGAANNRFYSGHFTRWDDFALKGQQAVNDAEDIAAFPFANIFHGCIFEFSGSVPRGTDGDALGHVHLAAAQWFGFDACNFAVGYTNPTAWFVCDTDNATSAAVMMIRARNCRFFSGPADTTFELRTPSAFATLVLDGQTYISNGAVAFSIADGAQVKILGDLVSGAAALFAHYGGGTDYQGDLLQGIPGTVDPPWIPFPYEPTTTVGDLGGAWQVAQYRKLPGGKVEVRGFLQNTGGAGIPAGSTIGTLPPGFRPTAKSALLGAFGDTAARWDVNTSGVITNSANLAPGANVQLKGDFYTS